jgi:hypothetical protein
MAKVHEVDVEAIGEKSGYPGQKGRREPTI